MTCRFGERRTEGKKRQATPGRSCGLTTPPHPVRVVVVGRGGRGRVLRPGATWTIGSGLHVDLRIDDPAVSREHCRLVHRGAELELTDLGSVCGIRLPGARIGRAVLPLDSAFEIGRTTIRLRRAISGAAGECCLPNMIGSAPVMRQLADLVRRCASLRVAALVCGATGTGKELVASALHRLGPCADGPFVVVNGATLSPELAGSELFGHQRGAFTGASSERRGAFRMADGGTLFIDEVASLPRAVQAKLLRATEEGTITPVGGDVPVAVRVRLVAATCEPLEELVRYGCFRSDLYQRLAACVLRVPPLSAHVEDIPALAHHLMETLGVGSATLAPDAIEQLQLHTWPGNVRELRNVLVQAVVRAESGLIRAETIAAVLATQTPIRRSPLGPERAVRLLIESGGNVSAAARRACMPRSTFRDLLRVAEG